MPEDAHTRLLSNPQDHDGGGSASPSNSHGSQQGLARGIGSHRARARKALSSHTKHYAVMAIVVLDVVALLANIFVQLIACEMHKLDEPWVQAWKDAITTAGLVFSCLFMVELVACLYSFGPSYLTTFFHLFDSTVIVASFVIDIVSRGLTESIGSLIVVLRLWRLAKISEEVVMGASERMDVLEQQMEELEQENHQLREQLSNLV